jgi:RNA polymerase sigma factor for flagellar operon FliA
MSFASAANISGTYQRKPQRTDPGRLAETHMPLVRKIAWHVHGRVSSAVDIEDLVQIGMVALVEAANGFEDRGFAFATYATMRIRGAMIDQLRRHAAICRSAMAKRRELTVMRGKLENLLGRTPSETEMASAMSMDPGSYRALVDSSMAIIHESIDEVYSDHSMWFANVEERTDEVMEREELKSVLADRISELPEREALVLQLYFVEEMNLDEIGQTLGVGAARVCQIKKSALDRLRGALSDWS